MDDVDTDLRARFANWIRARLAEVNLTEAELGAAIGRRPGWLVRFELGERPSRDLALVDAVRLVVLLGSDADSVFREIAALETRGERS